jgi:membrane protease YdiL (CAAX protease family)
LGETLDIHEKFFAKIGVNYLIYGMAALLFQILVLSIIGYANADILNDFNLTEIAVAFCNYVLPLPIIVLLMRELAASRLERHTPTVATFLKYVCITMTLMWIGNLTGLVITDIIGSATQSTISNPVQEMINTADIWLNLLLVSVIAPIFEEFVFRKLLIDRSIKYGARVSIILSAVIFSFFHGNLNQFFYAFLMGGFFAYVYIKTGNIIYPILLHITVNFTGSVVSLFVADSANALAQGIGTTFDLAFILIYYVLLLMILFIGIISLLRYGKSKFNGSKTEIALERPLRTVILNPGMVAFMVYYLFEIIIQLLG